jgi:hypothetical protein
MAEWYGKGSPELPELDEKKSQKRQLFSKMGSLFYPRRLKGFEDL